MAIKGSLKEAGLADVIQLLHLGRRTGCLTVTDRHNIGSIWFEDGQVIFAAIVNRRDRLGDLLVRNRRLTAEQLRTALDRQALERDRRLGEILIAEGMLSREDLEQYVRLQIEEAVFYLFTWTSGTFNFEAGVRPGAGEFLVRIGPEYLLLEGARRIDEWALIEKKIPGFDVVFTADLPAARGSGVALDPEQEQLLPLLDGTRDVRTLIDESGLGEFEVGKALYGLISAGFVQRTGATGALAPRQADARIEEHRNLGVAFYRTAMFDEAEREFRRVTELRPGDPGAPFFLGLCALRRGQWLDAIEQFTTALEKGGPRPAALANLAVALRLAGRLDDAERAYATAASRARDDWRVFVGWAVLALERGDADAADARLERAREVAGDRPPAIWYWVAALARVRAGDLAGASAIAHEGVEQHPGQAALAVNAGVLAEALGDLAQAERLLDAALALDPAVPQTSKNLGDLAYRAGRYDAAAQAYERAVRLAPDLGDDLHFKLGNLAFRKRDADAAHRHWTRAAELNPEHELARANLALLRAQP